MHHKAKYMNDFYINEIFLGPEFYPLVCILMEPT